jgi:plasmid replication initiation protein
MLSLKNKAQKEHKNMIDKEKRNKIKQVIEQSKKDGIQIAKSNALIQKARYKLTVPQQRILLYTISKIKPTDKEFQEYEFDLRELCYECGISNNGNNYLYFKEAVRTLSEQAFWITTQSGEQILCHWISKAKIDRNQTTIKITLDDDLKPYLLELKNNYTLLDKSILKMRSTHSQRLYEILRSYSHLGTYRTTLAELKKLLFIEDEYKEYKFFKIRVLKKAVNDINKLGEIYVEFKEIKLNRAVNEIEFIISHFTENPNYKQGIK